jgi:hypothetical protein
VSLAHQRAVAHGAALLIRRAPNLWGARRLPSVSLCPVEVSMAAVRKHSTITVSRIYETGSPRKARSRSPARHTAWPLEITPHAGIRREDLVAGLFTLPTGAGYGMSGADAVVFVVMIRHRDIHEPAQVRRAGRGLWNRALQPSAPRRARLAALMPFRSERWSRRHWRGCEPPAIFPRGSSWAGHPDDLRAPWKPAAVFLTKCSWPDPLMPCAGTAAVLCTRHGHAGAGNQLAGGPRNDS